MVCYNITAYNEIINFTVSKREVYNSKLRAGIKAERSMVMKSKNLERAVILGLILSTGVYGTAWAAYEISDDGNQLILTDEVITNASAKYNDRNLLSFKEIHITATNKDAISGSSQRYDLSETNVYVNISGTVDNSDGYASNDWAPRLIVNEFHADIKGRKSDAVNLSRNSDYNEYAKNPLFMANKLFAVVDKGNGIRANSTIRNIYYGKTETSIIINEYAEITINGNKGESGVAPDPTAVYAGDDNHTDPSFFGDAEATGTGYIDLNGEAYLYLNGKGNIGVWAGKNGKIDVENIEIEAKGENSIGIVSDNENINYKNNIVFKDNSKNFLEANYVTLDGNKNVIHMNGKNSKAIYASSEYGVVQSSNDGMGYIDIIGDIVAEDGGTINLDITRSTQNWLQGDIIAYGTQSSKNASVNLTTNAALAYQGDALAANGGIVDVKLGNGSSWAGRADDYQDATNSEWLKNHTDNLDTKFSGRVTGNGTVKIDMGTESTWNVTGQSWVTDLKGNNSYIILDNDENGNGYALHIEKITGANTFAMNISPEDNGNMLFVKDGTDEQQKLVINNRDEVLANMDVGDAVRFATVANAGHGFNDGEFTDLPENGSQTFGRSTRINDAGIFNVDFDIVYNGYGQDMQGDAADTEEDYNGDSFDKNKPGSDYVDKVYGGTDAQNVYIVRKSVTKENQSDAGKTVINMSRANYKNAIYMDRLNKRMGEMRYVNGEEEQGLWVRLRHDRIGQSGDFRSMNTMYEVGYDVKQPTDNGEHRIGMAIDYMRGSTTYDDIMGKGETKRYGLWLYDTWLGEKGHYVDYVAKWGHLSNDFDITAKTTGEKINGDYSNNVFSVSAEYGKKNDMGNNWYFEPQAQLQLARVTGADYVTTQGSKVNVDGINSLIGRAGFRIGRDMDENSTVYLKADLLHEFMGDQTVTAADATGTLREEFENKGTWYDVGFGFAAKMSKNSYAFMDFEKSFGNDNDETYQINAGMQWTF